mmetsp:Transcript_5384/g.17278  ORF Transcript_5384/g.17278 Transcript_5384/m.17278 type:complete len:208 (-) Transcript_5384:4-627(-)
MTTSAALPVLCTIACMCKLRVSGVSRSLSRSCAKSASSWKCVASIATQPVFSARWREIACASPNPSLTDVPRPISSTTTRLAGVARLRIAAIPAISTMKVDAPIDESSAAPTRARTASKIGTVAVSAGTKQPICAMTAIKACCLQNTDFPPMLGPVMTATASGHALVRASKLLATNFSRPTTCSSSAWRPLTIASAPLPATVSCGLQ